MDHSEHSHHSMPSGQNTKVEYIKFFSLVGLLVALAFVFADAPTEIMRIFMGLFLVTLASFKFIGYKMFVMMFAGYDVVAKRTKLYSYLYPFIELGLGLSYLFNLFAGPREILTILVMGVASIGVIQEVKKRSGVHCACLGNVIKLPLSTVSLVEDVAMVLMATLMLVQI